MDGFQKRAQRKKQQIIDAAHELFLTRGVKETTIQMIAKKANVSQVTIYNYYDSKENVLYEVVKLIFEAHTRSFEAIIYDSSKTFNDKMIELLEFQVRTVDELSSDLISTMHGSANERMKKLRKWYENNRIYVGMEHLVREGKNEGLISKDIDNDSIILLIELFKGVGDMPAINDKKKLKDLFYLFFYGISGKA